MSITLAGGKRGFSDGTGTAAQFNFGSNVPIGIAVDSGGNIYVPDSGNHTIRKVSPAGVVTTFAGDRNGGRTDGPSRREIFNPRRARRTPATTSTSQIRRIT